MMSFRAITIPLLLAFILVSLFGVFLTMSHTEHDAGCPLMHGQQAVLCSVSAIDHVRRWQIAFSSLLSNILLLIVGALVVYDRDIFALLRHAPTRPSWRYGPDDTFDTLQLFVRTVLHPRAP